MKRRDLIKLAGAPIAMVAIPASLSTVASAANSAAAGKSTGGAIELRNRQFQLSLSPGNGLNCRLVHWPSNTLLAEGGYSYSFGTPAFTEVRHDGADVVLVGRTDSDLTIEQRFTVHPSDSWIEEAIKITNNGPHPYVHSLRCGWVLPVRSDTLKSYVFTALPLRLDLDVANSNTVSSDTAALKALRARNRYLEFSLADILYRRRAYLDGILQHPETQTYAAQSAPRSFAENYAAEGWVLSDGRMGFVFSKYNQAQCEYAVLDRVYLPNGATGLRWGGTSSPDEMEDIHLAPGASYDFGTTRLSALQGDRTQGCYVFRAEMESRGHGTPENFDPPVHWNELYDNKPCCTGDANSHIDPRNRERFYRVADMKQAAAKAQAWTCDALYLDPGWDTPQSSKLWGEERLGKLADFIATLNSEYGGLKLALHARL